MDNAGRLCSCVGSSSGLHHDYHDNLYVLIKGKKRFKLYDPKHAENMYTVGKISEIHKNGRIVYEGQVCLSFCRLTTPWRCFLLRIEGIPILLRTSECEESC